jgi:hypothetical protein
VDCLEGTAVRLHHRGVNQTHIILYISFIITYSFFVIPAKAGIQKIERWLFYALFTAYILMLITNDVFSLFPLSQLRVNPLSKWKEGFSKIVLFSVKV